MLDASRMGRATRLVSDDRLTDCCLAGHAGHSVAADRHGGGAKTQMLRNGFCAKAVPPRAARADAATRSQDHAAARRPAVTVVDYTSNGSAPTASTCDV